MSEPIIELHGVGRRYGTGDGAVDALSGIDLTIHRGEMVAIVGSSGSGKSTMMNVIGCLDTPTSGTYRVAGREVAGLSPDELARLRRENFGFVFQRYHLLDALDAVGNVAVPAIYAGVGLAERRERAVSLLGRLGLEGRLDHKPSELSGGQQQRVSIARALMNGGEVILADEPTGALDQRSGQETLALLDELHAEGRTVVIVTHDMAVAERAERIVRMVDGRIVSDEPTRERAYPEPSARPARPAEGGWRAFAGSLSESFSMAVHAMASNKLRTFLTMLGIIVGIASVVSVVALGSGTRARVLENISSLGTNTLEIFPGASLGDPTAGRVKTLVLADAQALARQPYAAGVTPTVTTNATVRNGGIETSALVNGVGDEYFVVKGSVISRGRTFDADDVLRLSQDAVIDQNAQSSLFPDGSSPIGRTILVGSVPSRVVGVMQRQQGGFGGSQNPQVFLPYTTVQGRFLGDFSLRSISLRVKDDVPTDVASTAASDLLVQRHGTKDFTILNTDDIRQTITSTTTTLTLLISAIAVISLVVGGIGVMNIMLVSVVERTSEIGLRMAVGARQGDIMRQFLIEAALVCLAGGVIGVLLSLGIGGAFALANAPFQMIYSTTSIVVAVGCSTAIGLAFGFLPARNAARLSVVDALVRG